MEEELQLPCPGSSGHGKALGGQPWRSVCIFPVLVPRTCPVLERPAVREEGTASLAWQFVESQLREGMEEWVQLSWANRPCGGQV